MTPLRLSALLLAAAWLSASCTDRSRPHNELGRELALHLCAIQDECGCPEDRLIPDCESRVEREFAASEQQALAAGLELDRGCFEQALETIDALPSCVRDIGELGSTCPAYTAHANVGEACESYDIVPLMTECRAGLYCIQGTCRDLANPQLLYEGEICSDTQADQPTGHLGQCAEGLVCDSKDTRACVANPYWPPVPTGGQCTLLEICVEGSYCRPQAGDELPSEDRPGTCTLRTQEGEPCALFNECTARCIDGVCETQPPSLCEWLDAWWVREG